MLKSTAGGGGIGMQICADPATLEKAWDTVRRLSANNFSNDGVFLEKYIQRARHIEVQVFGDGQGGALALGERDCSAQRRHQKVLEETPAPNLPDKVRATLHDTARRLMEAVRYRNAGTVEFILDQDSHRFYFLEVNTRLQVEHGVTEQVYGVDLVDWMVRLAAGELPALARLGGGLSPRGHAIQARLYAEDPNKDFQPSAGLLTAVEFPEADGDALRIDHWIEPGLTVSPYYDPMLAKLIVHRADRDAALQALEDALADTLVEGIETNRGYLRAVLADPVFRDGAMTTRYLNDFRYRPRTLDVLAGGTLTTVQDYPGRQGYWPVGVPPSGPFDALSFRLGNRLLGNDEDAAGLEFTLNGPTLRFNSATRVALTGADMGATLDGEPVPTHRAFPVAAGQTLKLGKADGRGARAYLAVAGGIQCQPYLGSRATFTLGQFGGHGGRALRTGDVLHLSDAEPAAPATDPALPEGLAPALGESWELRVIYGPTAHPTSSPTTTSRPFSAPTGRCTTTPAAPASAWWARSRNGRAGTVARRACTLQHPRQRLRRGHRGLHRRHAGDPGPGRPLPGRLRVPGHGDRRGPLEAGPAQGRRPAALRAGEPGGRGPAGRRAGRLRGGTDGTATDRHPGRPGLADPGPPGRAGGGTGGGLPGRRRPLRAGGIRPPGAGPAPAAACPRPDVVAGGQGPGRHPGADPGHPLLQVHFDPTVLPRNELLALLKNAELTLDKQDDLEVPSRIVHLPLSWDDEACRLAIEKYTQSVRKDAPWCPSNIEFIRRINGLDGIDEVKRILFEASYVVMGLGDVYLGAPVATPTTRATGW